MLRSAKCQSLCVLPATWLCAAFEDGLDFPDMPHWCHLVYFYLDFRNFQYNFYTCHRTPGTIVQGATVPLPLLMLCFAFPFQLLFFSASTRTKILHVHWSVSAWWATGCTVQAMGITVASESRRKLPKILS